MTDSAEKVQASNIYANAGNTLFGLSGSLREFKINQAVNGVFDSFTNPTYDLLRADLRTELSANNINDAGDFQLRERQIWVDAINHGLSRIESVSGIEFKRLDPLSNEKADINWGALDQNLDLDPNPINPFANPKANTLGNVSVAEEHRQVERGLSQIWFYNPIIDPQEIFNVALHELMHAFGAIDGASDSPQESIVGNEALSGFEFLGTDVWSYDLGILDVYALQTTWGVNTEKYKEDTTYIVTGADTWGSGVLEGGVNVEADLLNSNPQPKAYQTIWDAGGLDTIDASGASGDLFGTGSTIDLRQGFFSSIGGLDDNVGIAFGAVIENATGSNADDVIVGNAVGNTIIANDGDDYIFGSAEALREFQQSPGEFLNPLPVFDGEFSIVQALDSSDEDWTYDGLNGQSNINVGRPPAEGDNDIIFGGEGDDRIFSGIGNDTVLAGDDDDVAFSGEGTDTVFGGKGEDELIGGGGSDILIGGGDSDTLYGDIKGGGNDGSTVNYLFGGEGDDHIHLGYNDFAIGGEGRDTFYVYTEVDNASSFDLKSVFILDFDPEQDSLFVNGVRFTGYQKTASSIQQLATIVNMGDGDYSVESDVYILDQQINGSYGSNQFRPNSPPSTINYYIDPNAPWIGTAFRNGNYRDVSVSNIGSLSSKFGLVSFVDADIVFPTSDTDALSFNLNDYLNVFVGELWTSDDSFFSRDAVRFQSGAVGFTSTIEFDSSLRGLIENFNINVPIGGHRIDQPLPEIENTGTFTGFNAEQKTISRLRLDEARVAAAAVAQSDVAASSSATFATSKIAASQFAIQGGTVANASISFIYDNLIEITLPALSADLQFVAFEGLLEKSDLSKFSISEFGNILSLNELGLVPDNAVLTSVSNNIGVVQFGLNRDEILSGSSGNDLLVGSGGNDQLILNTNDAADVDLLVGGLGDDEYILSGSQGAFDKIVIAERLADDEPAGGIDILRINANSTEITVVEGNSPDDLRILVPNVPNPRGPDPISDGFGIIDVMNQLGDNPDDWIEEIHFSDRVVWTRTQLIAAAVAADPVSVGAIDDVTIVEDNAVEFSVQDAFIDPYRRDLEYSATLVNGDPLPSWLSVADGNVTGTPPSNFNGQLDIAVTGTIGAESVTTSFSLTISPVNDAPEINNPLDSVVLAEDDIIDLAIPLDTFVDVDGDTLSLSASLLDGSVLPAWLMFDGTRFTGVPPQDFNGTIDLTVTASDGSLNVSDNFTLTIDPVNDAPVLSLMISDQTSLEDAAINIAVPTGTFTDVDVDPLTLSATLTDGSTLPAWLQFDGSNFTGAPPTGFIGGLDLRVTASDGLLSVSDDFILTIEAPTLGMGIPYPAITNIVEYDSFYMVGVSTNDAMFAASSSNNTNMVGLGGNDLLISESTNSSLQGRDGIDVLVIRNLDARVYGDAEGDQYGNVTGPGNSQSADYFVFDIADYVGPAWALNPSEIWATVKDYSDGNDKIAILNGSGGVNGFGDLTITQNGTSVDISTHSIPKIVLENTLLSDIDASDFIFGDGSNGTPTPSTGIPYPSITNIAEYDSFYMAGGSDNDAMFAASSSNNTNMVALGGNDLLISESWNSSLQGREGTDILVMRAGGIRAYGDAEGDQYGNVTAPGSTQSVDYFVFDIADYVGASYELDPLYVWADIKDYADGVDKIAILNGTGGVNSFADLTITQNGTSVDISTPTIPKIVLENTAVADIDASDFIFGDGSTASAQSASAPQNIFVDDYRRYARNFRLQAPIEGRFREPDVLYSEVPELSALRAGLNRESFSLSSLVLTRDAAVDIFDYYDQLNKNPYKQPSSFAQSQMATTPDVVSKEVVSASSSAANNADALKIALMTQDMNMFGVSPAVTSMKMQDRSGMVMDYFAA